MYIFKNSKKKKKMRIKYGFIKAKCLTKKVSLFCSI